ncbi:MAG: hypothetical protein JXR03_04950 [Cyclobacteriaceae bacterium]
MSINLKLNIVYNLPAPSLNFRNSYLVAFLVMIFLHQVSYAQQIKKSVDIDTSEADQILKKELTEKAQTLDVPKAHLDSIVTKMELKASGGVDSTLGDFVEKISDKRIGNSSIGEHIAKSSIDTRIANDHSGYQSLSGYQKSASGKYGTYLQHRSNYLSREELINNILENRTGDIGLLSNTKYDDFHDEADEKKKGARALKSKFVDSVSTERGKYKSALEPFQIDKENLTSQLDQSSVVRSMNLVKDSLNLKSRIDGYRKEVLESEIGDVGKISYTEKKPFIPDFFEIILNMNSDELLGATALVGKEVIEDGYVGLGPTLTKNEPKNIWGLRTFSRYHISDNFYGMAEMQNDFINTEEGLENKSKILSKPQFNIGLGSTLWIYKSKSYGINYQVLVEVDKKIGGVFFRVGLVNRSRQ